MLFEDGSKVSFRGGMCPTILDIINLQKGFVGVLNVYFKAGKFLTQLLEGITNSLKLLSYPCRTVGVLIKSDGFVPGLIDNLHEPRLSDPI